MQSTRVSLLSYDLSPPPTFLCKMTPPPPCLSTPCMCSSPSLACRGGGGWPLTIRVLQGNSDSLCTRTILPLPVLSETELETRILEDWAEHLLLHPLMCPDGMVQHAVELRLAVGGEDPRGGRVHWHLPVPVPVLHTHGAVNNKFHRQMSRLTIYIKGSFFITVSLSTQVTVAVCIYTVLMTFTLLTIKL